LRKDRENFLDEDVLRVQNEVRRYHDEQGIHDGDVTGEMQRGDGTGTDTGNVSGKSRSNFLQDAPAAAKRQ